MVSTRRSRSAGGESEQIVSTHGSQEDVSSRQAAAQPLDPISEELAAPTPARRRRGASQQQQQHLTQTQEQQHQQVDALAHDVSEQGMQQQVHQQVEPAAGQQPRQPPAIQQPSDDSSSEEEDDDLDFDGPGVLQNLAAAIRSGFQSQSQQQRQTVVQQQQQQPSGSLQAAAAAAAAAARSSGRELNDEELQQLRWRPHTGLQMPAQAAAAMELVRPMQTKRGQRQQQLSQDEHVGAQVESAPAAATDGAGVSSSGLQQSRGAAAQAAAAASKPAGLSKALTAPTLDAAARTKEAKKAAPDTAGSKWFGLPAPKITEELKRDLRVLRLRGAYDTKRFYKSFDNTKFPKYFAVGTVVDDPMDNNRLSKGQRRATMTEQLLVDSELTHSRKRRFNKLQDEAQKYKKTKKRKTSQPRKTPAKHRPKH